VHCDLCPDFPVEITADNTQNNFRHILAHHVPRRSFGELSTSTSCVPFPFCITRPFQVVFPRTRENLIGSGAIGAARLILNRVEALINKTLASIENSTADSSTI
jgi:hypothetical protein